MQPMTYFRAYESAQSRKRAIESVRGIRSGIAVDKDRHALAWQRVNRQAEKFRSEIVRVLLAAAALGDGA